MLEWALKYAGLGWKVFPLAPRQKIPITSHGVKDATSDEQTIREWWARNPLANIGLACGKESGVYVIDVDIDSTRGIDGLESLKEFDTLPTTVLQRTPRGGFHAFYKTDDPPANRNSFRKGIDIRGDGYYVVLPPSVHPNGRKYEWEDGLSPWEATLSEYPTQLRPVKKSPWIGGVIAPRPTAPAPGSTDTLKRASLYLAQCDPAVQGLGGHDKLLWAAVALVHGFCLTDSQAYDLLAREYNPVCMPPWNLADPKDEKDFRRKITEARKLQPSYQHGWLLNDPAYEPHDDLVDIDVQALIGSGLGRVEVCEQVVESRRSKSEMEFLCSPVGLLGEICSWINSLAIKDQPFLALGCTLTFLGALFGRKVRDEYGNRTNLYCMGIAPSSAGKANAIERIRDLCAHSGMMECLGGDSVTSDSALETALAEHPTTLFLWDEVGHFFSKSKSERYSSAVISTLMKLYSSSSAIYRGKSYADKDRQKVLIQPCCCVYGTSTPERFVGSISTGELIDGWLSRCLVFYSTSNPSKKRSERDFSIPRPILDSIKNWVEFEVPAESNGTDLTPFVCSSNCAAPPRQLVVKTTPKANEIFCTFDREASTQSKENPGTESIWAKAEENARKIALIVACAKSIVMPLITEDCADYACRLVGALIVDFCSAIIPEVVDTSVGSDKRKILSIIKGYGKSGCSKTAITRATQGLMSRYRDDCLRDLIEAGEVILSEAKTGKPGRPSVRYIATCYVSQNQSQ